LEASFDPELTPAPEAIHQAISIIFQRQRALGLETPRFWTSQGVGCCWKRLGVLEIMAEIDTPHTRHNKPFPGMRAILCHEKKEARHRLKCIES